MVQPDTAHWNSFVHPFIYSFYQSLNKSSDCSARCWVYNKETRRYKIEWEAGSKYTNFQSSVQLKLVIGTITVKTWGDERIIEESQEDGSQAAPFKLPVSDELAWSERSPGKKTEVEAGAGLKGSGLQGRGHQIQVAMHLHKSGRSWGGCWVLFIDFIPGWSAAWD